MYVKNNNKIRVDTRVNVLALTIGEYAKAFGADKGCLESIKRGVYERQIIEQIELHYYSKKEYVGRIKMKIDWECHRVLVGSENGNAFRIDTNKNILEQLDSASQEIILHVRRLREKCRVTKVEVIYRYRKEYLDNKKKYDEARSFLGHVQSEKSMSETSSGEFKSYIRFIMDKLKELEIVVES